MSLFSWLFRPKPKPVPVVTSRPKPKPVRSYAPIEIPDADEKLPLTGIDESWRHQ
jgi:hypothetical protein